MRFNITAALLSLAIVLGSPVDTNNEDIKEGVIHHKKTEKKAQENGDDNTYIETRSLDSVVGLCERVKEICEDTASFTSELFTSDDESSMSNEDKKYKLRLEEHLNSLFASIPQKYIPNGFMDEYFKEFFESYFEDYKKYRFLPKAVVVVDKSKVCRKDKPEIKGCKKSYYLYYFNFDSKKTQPEKSYEVGIGKDKGKTRAETKGDVKITPEGIFWIDEMVIDPVSYYKKVFENDAGKKGIGKYYGSRLIGFKVPQNRSYDELIAFHGTTTEAQWTIGKARSRGCLRMYNNELIDFYEILLRQDNKGEGILVVITP